MKIQRRISLSLCVFLVGGVFVVACRVGQNPLSKEDKIDSAFEKNYAILDSIAKRNILDVSDRCKNAIGAMEKMTNIKATSDGNYFSAILFTSQDLKQWKEWYDNRELSEHANKNK